MVAVHDFADEVRLPGRELEVQGADRALEHLALATCILEEVGARNEVAKVLVARAGCHRAAGNVAAARTDLEQALAVFTSLGTVDGPLLVASLLQSLPNGIDTERAQPAS